MSLRGWLNAIATWLLVAATIITILWFAGTHVAGASSQRFVRVGWDVLEVSDNRTTVMDTIKDTKTGMCRAFYRVEYLRDHGMYTGAPAIALAEFGPINCDGQAPVVVPFPFPVASAIK